MLPLLQLLLLLLHCYTNAATAVVVSAVALRVRTKTAGQLCCQRHNNDGNATATQRSCSFWRRSPVLTTAMQRQRNAV